MLGTASELRYFNHFWKWYSMWFVVLHPQYCDQ